MDLFLFKQLLEMVFDSGEVDGALLYGIFGWSDFMVNLETRFPEIKQMQEYWESRYTDFLNQLAEIPKTYGKPLFVMSFSMASSASIRPLTEQDVPVFPSASRAACAMRALLDYRTIRDGR
jgi:hypothetical protein